MACAPSEDSDQPGHSPSLIRVFAILMNERKAKTLIRLGWVYSHFVGFVMTRFMSLKVLTVIPKEQSDLGLHCLPRPVC